MTRPARLILFALLLAVALAAAVFPSILPPKVVTAPPPHWRPGGSEVRGAYHLHSTRSDGTGSPEEIAAAAARAGLQFIILTDHGDATRTPDPPRYRSGVLCIDAVEINTAAGHLVALGASPSAYPLAGSAEAVVEDVHRLGGMAIAAHPGSPRASLGWRDWTARLEGLEWLNADSEWRDEFVGSLGRLLLTYPVRPAETLASTLDRPTAVMEQWDTLARVRRTVGLAGADAHARLGFGQQSDPYEEGWHLPLPSYETSLRAFSLRVSLDDPLSGDPEQDAANVLTRLRWGRVYTVVDGLAGPGALEFTATSGSRFATMGDYLDVEGNITLHVRRAAPPAARVVVLRDGVHWFDTTEPELHVGVPSEPAVFRVEVHLPDAPGEPPVPWMVSNPIYVGLRDSHLRAASPPPPTPSSARVPIATEAWVAESSPGSASQLDLRALVEGEAAIPWTYRLAPGTPAGQYAAVSFAVAGLQRHDRLQLRARADRPMRLSIQLRQPAGGGQRWGQTVYLDPTYRTTEIFFDRVEPLGVVATERPPLASVDALLLVVDTLNTRPGDGGRIDIAELWLGQP